MNNGEGEDRDLQSELQELINSLVNLQVQQHQV